MSFDYRKDGRTEEEFAADIKRRSIKEKFLINLFEKELAFRGKPVIISDNGIDNSGELMKGKITACPDYLIEYPPFSFMLDVKNSYVSTKCTFKVSNLRHYVKNRAGILLFYGTGKLDQDPTQINYETTRWAIITPEKIGEMLLLKHYHERAFGNKICVQIKNQDFWKFFLSHRLEHIWENIVS